MMRRRTALLSGVGVASAWVVGWGLLPPRSRVGDAQAWPNTGEAIALNGWIKITAQGQVKLAMPRCEMGQGIHTALSMLVAEELEVPVHGIECVSAGLDTIYGNLGVLLAPLPRAASAASEAETADAPKHVSWQHWLVHKGAREWGLQLTTGSSSMMDAWEDLRLAAATARAQLLRAASLRWHQAVDELVVNQGVITHPVGAQAHYGELAATAALTRPGEVRLKPAAQWRVIGRPRAPSRASTAPRWPPQFGMDLRLPGMLYASVRHAPSFGASLGEVAWDAVLRAPGVERVVRLGTHAGATAAVAVVARSTWHALRAARGLQAAWRPAAEGTVNSDHIVARLQAQALQSAQLAGVPWRDPGPNHHMALYTLPYAAHLPLEPTQATAKLQDGRLTVWAPTQSPTTARTLAALVAGVREDDVVLNVMPAGGSFGRRMEIEVIGQAVRVALETQGRPVQLMWPREEDLAHDFYRPAGAAVLQATLDEGGWPVDWHLYSAGDAVTPRWLSRHFPAMAMRRELPDGHWGEGPPRLPYGIPHTIQHHATHSGVPVGHWRGGAHTGFAFASESFMDELAHRGEHDPLAYRLRLLRQQPETQAVLNLLAEKAQWARALPAGVARGLALHACAHSVVAMVAEVRAQQGQVQVLRVVCVADVGTVVHPGGVAQQLEGGIMYGLNAALWGQVDVRDSQARLTAGHEPWLTVGQSPRIETHCVHSPRAPGGVGGIATPVIAPAVANAWFRLTGERLRRLPLRTLGQGQKIS